MCRFQQQIPTIEKLEPQHFLFEYWRAGSLSDLGIQTKTISITHNRHKIRDHAIGYLDGERLWVRSKKETMAVMFWLKDHYFWTHLTKKEFFICFPEIRDD